MKIMHLTSNLLAVTVVLGAAVPGNGVDELSKRQRPPKDKDSIVIFAPKKLLYKMAGERMLISASPLNVATASLGSRYWGEEVVDPMLLWNYPVLRTEEVWGKPRSYPWYLKMRGWETKGQEVTTTYVDYTVFVASREQATSITLACHSHPSVTTMHTTVTASPSTASSQTLNMQPWPAETPPRNVDITYLGALPTSKAADLFYLKLSIIEDLCTGTRHREGHHVWTETPEPPDCMILPPQPTYGPSDFPAVVTKDGLVLARIPDLQWGSRLAGPLARRTAIEEVIGMQAANTTSTPAPIVKHIQDLWQGSQKSSPAINQVDLATMTAPDESMIWSHTPPQLSEKEQTVPITSVAASGPTTIRSAARGTPGTAALARSASNPAGSPFTTGIIKTITYNKPSVSDHPAAKSDSTVEQEPKNKPNDEESKSVSIAPWPWWVPFRQRISPIINERAVDTDDQTTTSDNPDPIPPVVTVTVTAEQSKPNSTSATATPQNSAANTGTDVTVTVTRKDPTPAPSACSSTTVITPTDFPWHQIPYEFQPFADIIVRGQLWRFAPIERDLDDGHYDPPKMSYFSRPGVPISNEDRWYRSISKITDTILTPPPTLAPSAIPDSITTSGIIWRHIPGWPGVKQQLFTPPAKNGKPQLFNKVPWPFTYDIIAQGLDYHFSTWRAVPPSSTIPKGTEFVAYAHTSFTRLDPAQAKTESRNAMRPAFESIVLPTSFFDWDQTTTVTVVAKASPTIWTGWVGSDFVTVTLSPNKPKPTTTTKVESSLLVSAKQPERLQVTQTVTVTSSS